MAIAIDLADGARQQLEVLRRAKTTPQGIAQRTEIVLRAAEGLGNSEIARLVGCSRPTAILWRRRFAEKGITGLYDEPGRGRRPTYDQAKVEEIVATTIGPPPAGQTHWSARAVAKRVGVSAMTVCRVWREHRLQPHRARSFKFSYDPQLAQKVTDVVGLYLHPPEKAVVLSADEKSQIQALDRTQPLLPLRPGQVERHTHDYVRHGTTTLFAALDVATGAVTGCCYEKHRHQEFLRFLRLLARTYHQGEVHLILDNYATHEHPEVRRWLERNRRFHLHFTPTSASWMNQVETWFSILTRQAIRRGSFSSLSTLSDAIQRFIDNWNDQCRPFAWVKSTEEILSKESRKPNSVTVH